MSPVKLVQHWSHASWVTNHEPRQKKNFASPSQKTKAIAQFCALHANAKIWINL